MSEPNETNETRVKNRLLAAKDEIIRVVKRYEEDMTRMESARIRDCIRIAALEGGLRKIIAKCTCTELCLCSSEMMEIAKGLLPPKEEIQSCLKNS